MMINVFALNNVRDQKEINKYGIYKKVLKKIHHRIKVIASKGDTFCFYIVPEFIFGIPKYDTLNCAEYLVKKLKMNGFKVLYTYPNLIFISWNHVPSEIKNPEIRNVDVKKIINNNRPKQIENNYRYIDDYKPSVNFLNKLNKRITYN